ncbi:hypothetical protein BD560DRAFT_441204 [Blakeslea trispora]|nr:hypothetical protein BD560DRAFT_441204 [Blakeslea trispora]
MLEEAVPEKYRTLLDKEIGAAFEDDFSIASEDLTSLSQGNKYNAYMLVSDVEANVDCLDSLISNDVLPLPMQTREHLYYNLALNPNNNNPCYIDASFELLIECTVPHAKNSFESACDPKNAMNQILLDPFNCYENGNSFSGSQLIRNLVWSKNTQSTRGQSNKFKENQD